MIKYFSAGQYLTAETFSLILLSCEDKQLRRMAKETRPTGQTPISVDIAMVEVLKSELTLQRNLESLKEDLQNKQDFSFNAAFQTLDVDN